MKALTQDRYGSADVLKLRDIQRPLQGTGKSWYASSQRGWTAARGTS